MSLFRYLSSHTVHRWREQPWSPLGRGAVAFMISTAALATLGSFDAAERELVRQLERSGANTLSIFTPLPAGAQPVAAERYGWLESKGRVLATLRLYRGATDDLGRRVTLYSYGPDAAGALAGLESDNGCFLIGGPGPVGLISTVSVDDLVFSARHVLAELPAKLPADGAELIALVPRELLSMMLATEGGTEVVVLDNTSAEPTSTIAAALDRFHAADKARASVVSAATLMDKIGELREKKALAMSLLGGGAIALIALVFGALAALEYRESRFVFALLRSMGATRLSLYGQALTESLLVAVAGGALACAILPSVVAFLAGRFALSPAGASAFVAPTTTGVLFLALAAGALVASLPAALGLRVPFGRILD